MRQEARKARPPARRTGLSSRPDLCPHTPTHPDTSDPLESITVLCPQPTLPPPGEAEPNDPANCRTERPITGRQRAETPAIAVEP